VVGCWHGYLSGAKCRFAYGPADATATHYLSFQSDWFYLPGFTFLHPAHPGSSGHSLEGYKMVVVVAVAVVSYSVLATATVLAVCPWL